MKYHTTCTYCGYEEIMEINAYQKNNQKCYKCKDKNLKFREYKTCNVFGYTDEELQHFEDDKTKDIDIVRLFENPYYTLSDTPF